MKVSACVAVLLANAWRLAGQTAAELEARQGDEALATARSWVQDGDPRHLAWAAFWAGRDHLTQLEPDLIKQLSAYNAGSKQWNGKAEPDDVDAEAVADALIRLGAHVPEQSAAVLYPKLPAQALILLSRASDDPEVTLERIFNEANPFEWLNWLAAADLLAVSHPRSIAPRLLSDFTMTLQVRVLDPGQGYGSSMGGGCAADQLLFPDLTIPEWPAIREYKLSLDTSPNAEVAKGANPVYFQSWETRFYNPYAPDGDCHLGEKAKLR